MRKLTLIFSSAFVIWSVGCGQNAGPPAKHPWSSFKVGSYVKMRMTSVMNVAGRQMNTTSEIKQTLVELTATQAVVDLETTVMGKTTTTRKEYPLSVTDISTSIPNLPSASSVRGKKTGTETLTVGGKSLSCKWTEASVTQGAMNAATKFYWTEQIPGFIAKMITKTTGGANSEITMEAVEFLAK